MKDRGIRVAVAGIPMLTAGTSTHTHIKSKTENWNEKSVGHPTAGMS